jgi:hypothetical protein
MKCFYHVDRDAVGTCSQCSKAACRECIHDIGGGMLCQGCMALQLQHQYANQQAQAADIEAIRSAARQKLRTSKVLFFAIAVLGCVIGFGQALSSLGDPKAPPFIGMLLFTPVAGLGAGYLLWSCYWGIPAIWRKWWGMLRGMGCFLFANPFTWLIVIIALFELPLMAGYIYGVFGGGIYEYRKCRRIADGLP